MTDSQGLTAPNPSDPVVLVESFAESKTRFQTLTRLQAMGPDALSAVRQGLKHQDWHVRHWCAIYLDRDADPDTLRDLVPLLHDPVAKVRLWAIHSISCEHCKGHKCPFDVVPLLIERVENDESTRARKMAVVMLASLPLDSRVVPVLKAVLNKEQDVKIRLHADLGLQRYRDAGIMRKGDRLLFQ